MNKQSHLASLPRAIAAMCLCFASCAKDNSQQNTENLVLALVGASIARYQVTFYATWSPATHSGGVLGIPANPHFSRPIGAAHTSSMVFWKAGATASNGIERMAEGGATDPLLSEMQVAGASSLTTVAGIASPGASTMTLTVSTLHPQITWVTMVAPSPDWFAGVHNLDLYTEGGFLSSKSIDLLAYDAGSDDGASFTAPDADSSPKQPIQLIAQTPLQNNPIGRLEIVRQ